MDTTSRFVSTIATKRKPESKFTSKGFRNPTIRELYMFRPTNPDLLPERLWNYELSYSQRLLKGTFYYGVNLFTSTGTI